MRDGGGKDGWIGIRMGKGDGREGWAGGRTGGKDEVRGG